MRPSWHRMLDGGNCRASTVARVAHTGEAVRRKENTRLRSTCLAFEAITGATIEASNREHGCLAVACAVGGSHRAARRDRAAEITYDLAPHCQSDKAKPRHMDGAFYETTACVFSRDAKRRSGSGRLMNRLEGNLDLHLVAEHHAARFDGAVPLYTVIEPVHGRAGFETKSLPAVRVVLQPKEMSGQNHGFGHAANR